MLYNIFKMLFLVYYLMLLVRILGSWIEAIRNSQFMRFIAHYTDPFLNIFRKVIPPIGGVLDVSPILAFIVLQIIEKIVLSFFR